MKDYYAILGVAATASIEEIRRAFRQLARRYHPDVNPDADAADKFHEIYTAYQVLSDPSLRAEYDAARSGRSDPRARSRSDSTPDARRAYFQRLIHFATNPSATWNYYDVLGVQVNATEETIARAYQRLYQEFYHGSESDPSSAAILREITDARDVLTDPERRHAYDLLPPDQQPPGRPRMDESPPTGQRQQGAGGSRGSGCLLAILAIPLLVLSALARRIFSA